MYRFRWAVLSRRGGCVCRVHGWESALALNLAIAAMFGMLALLAVYGLFRAFLSDSEHRAEDAERQQGVAQRLEQDGKRTNDQNQARLL